MKKLIVILLVAFSALNLVQAGDYAANATELGNPLTLNGIITNNMTDGDTLTLPQGSPTWTESLVINKRITVKGAGMGLTVINRKHSPTSAYDAPAVKIAVSTNGSDVPFPRLTGVTLTTIAGEAVQNNQFSSLLLINGTTTKFRVDHVKIVGLNGSAMWLIQDARGVLDHCDFRFAGNADSWVRSTSWPYPAGSAGFGTPALRGDGAWADDPYTGTDKYVYLEDCWFHNGNPNIGNDGDAAGRYVVRHSRLENHTGGHGTDSTGRVRGMRSVECYNNIYDRSGTGSGGAPLPSGYAAGQIRSGIITFFNNIIIHYDNSLVIFGSGALERLTDSLSPFKQATGINPWDSNLSTVYQSGTVASASSGLTVTLGGITGSVAANAYQRYSIRRTGGTGGGPVAAYIKSNLASSGTSLAVTYFPHATGTSDTSFGAGSTYEIRQVDVVLDEPGRGKGDSLVGGSDSVEPTNLDRGGALWPRNAAEGNYMWNNHNGSLGGPLMNGQVLNSGPIRSGREIFSGLVRPGYPQTSSPTAVQTKIGPDAEMCSLGGFTDPNIHVTSADVYGYDYPHPLISLAPDITSTSATFSNAVNSSFTIQYANFTAAPYFTKTGALPAGVTMNTAGVISGTPSSGAGTFPITLTAVYPAPPAAATETATQAFSVTVTSPNAAPTVTMTATGAPYNSPATVNLAASPADSDGTVASVEFRAGTTSIATITSPPYTYTWTGVAAGSYAILARATDNFGLTGDSPITNITVAPPVAGSTPTPPANILVGP